MTVFGICLVRDAVDIIGPVVSHMLTQVDHVIVADNLSTDGTSDVLRSLPVQVLRDIDPGHRQGDKTTALARRAWRDGARWVVPFDADEHHYAPGFARIADFLATVPDDIWLVHSELYDHVATALDDPQEPNPVARIGWRRRAPGPLPKVACRASHALRIEEGNHGAKYRMRVQSTPGIVVRHFPYRSAEQMAAKAVAGARALDEARMPPDVGRHWRDYARLVEAHGPSIIGEVFREHFYAEDPHSREDLIFDPAPPHG